MSLRVPKGRRVQRTPTIMTSDFNRIKSVLRKPPLTKYPELEALFAQLPTLRGLAFRRARLVTAMAPTQRRVNPSNPNRATIEKSRRILRRTLRAEIGDVERQMAVLLTDIIIATTDPAGLPVSEAALEAMPISRDRTKVLRATKHQLEELQAILTTPITKQRKRRTTK